MITIQKYTSTYKEQWDEFVANSKNATFLFYRDFMEYHSDRFTDYSLLVFRDAALIALMPANRTENEVYSHQGLSYGGIILDNTTDFSEVAAIFSAILLHLETDKVETLQLKLLPDFYTALPSSEMEQLLFLIDAKMIRSDITSTICYDNPLPITSSNRIRGIKKGKRNNLEVRQETDFTDYWNAILTPNLLATHNKKPVHTCAEITLLHQRFPKNIKQFNVYWQDKIVGGVTIFETDTVAHAQYISSSIEGRKIGALDVLFDYLIAHYKHKKYFDFGISTESQGRRINKGLLSWKESFGGRTFVHRFYEVNVSAHSLLKDIYL